MRPLRKLNRRSFLGQVAGGAVTAGSLGLIGGQAARAQTGPYTGVTDNDSGSYADNAGHGRGPGGNASGNPNTQTGYTDSDPTDRAGAGRGGNQTGYSDSDSGAGADPSGGGRRGNRVQTGHTDSDPTDRSGEGRGPDSPRSRVRGTQQRPDGRYVTYSGLTDTDSGQTRDPSGYGQGTGQRCHDQDYARSDSVVGGRQDTSRVEYAQSDYARQRVDPGRAC